MYHFSPPPFVSLWQGPPGIHDHVESTPPGGTIPITITLQSTGLYGLDRDGRPWVLVNRLYKPRHLWVLLDDLLSGAAGRAVVAEENPTPACES